MGQRKGPSNLEGKQAAVRARLPPPQSWASSGALQVAKRPLGSTTHRLPRATVGLVRGVVVPQIKRAEEGSVVQRVL